MNILLRQALRNQKNRHKVVTRIVGRSITTTSDLSRVAAGAIISDLVDINGELSNDGKEFVQAVEATITVRACPGA